MTSHPSHQAGVSLIEALVALVVMAFGVLGVAGLQATMRQNADISKQRSEAVRIAQESIEDGRSFTVLATPPPPASGPAARAYEDVKTAAASTVIGYTTNTDYTLTRTVLTSASPSIKTLAVDVAWTDRTGQTQSVRLNTSIAGLAPELAGSLGIPANGTPTRQPRGRSVDIPVAAVDHPGDGTSVFTPPGAPTVRWVFNNVTGIITSICNPAEVCTDQSAFLLSGYVRFATVAAAPPATGASAPTAKDAENPPSGAFALDVQVGLTSPSVRTISCFEQTLPAYVVYYCAVPITSTSPFQWSGQSVLVTSPGQPIASLSADSAAGHYKVCRYTPGRGEDANSDGVADGDKPLNGNIDHPLVYSNVPGPLSNQNFLVIRAGDGMTPFACPGDDASTPFVNGSTWPHQPHSL